MASESGEQGIFTGVAGSFCLLCEVYITKSLISHHIATSEHAEKLKRSTYVEKYKDDRVRKVQAGYYCALCNILIPTLSKLAIHVANSAHTTNKTYHLVREIDEGLVAFDDILIEKKAWHGLNEEGSCLICNLEYSDEKDHAKESQHILNLIQNKFELKKNKFVYRKVEDTILNCLVCNCLITFDSKESHTEDLDHVNNYTKCQENFRHVNGRNQPATTDGKKTILPNDTGSFVKLNQSPTNKIRINKDDIVADADHEKLVVESMDICNVKSECDKSVDLSNCIVKSNCEKSDDKSSEKSDAITDSENSTDKTVAIYNGKTVREKLVDIPTENIDVLTPEAALKRAMKFAKENHLKYKRTNTYCKVCNVKISSSFIRLKEHVAEQKHIEKAATYIKPEIVKVPMAKFTNNVFSAKNFFLHDIVINFKICLDILSYHTLTRNGSKFRCQICEVSTEGHEINFHINSWKHIKAFEETTVLKVFYTELVREVRPGLYHCGFCNFIEASMSGLKKHLKSINHGEMKAAAQRRLIGHMSDYVEQKQREKLARLFQWF